MSQKKKRKNDKIKKKLKDKMKNIIDVDEGRVYNTPKEDINADLNLDEELFVSSPKESSDKSDDKSSELFESNVEKLNTVTLNKISDDKLEVSEKESNIPSRNKIEELEADANVRKVFGLDQDNITGKELDLLEKENSKVANSNNPKINTFSDEADEKFVLKGIKRYSKDKMVSDDEKKSIIINVILELLTFLVGALAVILLSEKVFSLSSADPNMLKAGALIFVALAIVFFEVSYRKKDFLLFFKGLEITFFAFGYMYLVSKEIPALVNNIDSGINFKYILIGYMIYATLKTLFVLAISVYKVSTNKTDVKEIV